MAVYLMGNVANGLVKIGTSQSPQRRLRAVQQTSPVALTLLWVSADYWSYRMERALHERFAVHRHHGEWFDLNGGDAVEVIARTVEQLAPSITEIRVPEPVVYQPVDRGITVDDLLRLAERSGFTIAPDTDLEQLASLCAYGERDEIVPVHPATWRSS